MAKSLRSKWKRKMKAVKRERYAAKELIKLEGVVKKAGGKVEMEIDKSLVNVRDKETIKIGKKSKTMEHEGKMEVDSEKMRSMKTFKDENGQYPVWMNQRAIKKLKSKQGKGRKKGKKKAKSAW